jgi:hypothetical protein
VGEGRRGGGAQTMYAHVSKCKKNKIKEQKINPKDNMKCS